jgi:adenylosuccinate synthase
MMTLPDARAVYARIYERGDLAGVDRPLLANPLTAAAPPAVPRTVAVAGGAFGDEGKGRIVDELCARFVREGTPPLVIRWNGGANAGHTVIVNGERVALHQLPSGALRESVTVVLGKGMVIHPADLLTEIRRVGPHRGQSPARIYLHARASLALDTHRAYESVLLRWHSGGSGATGRGIAPAYADVLLRHPVRVADLFAPDWESRLSRHYDLYAALVSGLAHDLSAVNVPMLGGDPIPVGARADFLARLRAQREALTQYLTLTTTIPAPSGTPIIFEGAQAIGLDLRFGVYPDVTASDPTFDGILNGTEGAFRPENIAVRAGALKATYTSSVGARRLPTHMPELLASRIREDAHEYGATTRRPRDIAYIDLPCLGYFARVSGMTHLILTHLDIAYPDTPIRVCVGYTDAQGQPAAYQPDQDYLNGVTPHYLDLPTWDGAAIRNATRLDQLPKSALQYIAFLCGALGLQPFMATTGPDRDALISWI